MQVQLADMPVIPAMTTDAEREFYYRLVLEAAEHGAVIELGAWLGASTAYIAAAMRDGRAGKAHVYDKFLSKPGHADKVRTFYARRGMQEIPQGPCLAQFKANLGNLMAHVVAHQCEIANIEWGDDRIAVLISDAPKRVPAISAVLTRLRHGLQPGSVMAWQDFCHFPSYEIPACLYRLRGHLEFIQAVVPGTTLAFRVTSQWEAEEVSPEALAVNGWSPDEIVQAWEWWIDGYVPAEKRSLFLCGRALFLCDIGQPDEAVDALDAVYQADAAAIVPKWQYLHRGRTNLIARYQPLFDYLAARGAL